MLTRSVAACRDLVVSPTRASEIRNANSTSIATAANANDVSQYRAAEYASPVATPSQREMSSVIDTTNHSRNARPVATITITQTPIGLLQKMATRRTGTTSAAVSSRA